MARAFLFVTSAGLFVAGGAKAAPSGTSPAPPPAAATAAAAAAVAPVAPLAPVLPFGMVTMALSAALPAAALLPGGARAINPALSSFIRASRRAL
uniref:Putative secreted protein n=1 Tax=Anopheles triannulatus TaxID=58253 RepID=A0A2M4B3Y3_9DIPT